MTATNIIGVRQDSDVPGKQETVWHAGPSGGCGNMDTLCGMDANDAVAGTYGIAPPTPSARRKITCPQCRMLWEAWQSIKDTDFAVSNRG